MLKHDLRLLQASLQVFDALPRQPLEIDGAVSIELEYSPEPDKIAEWVAEAYHATDRLMRAAGLRDS